MKTNHLPQTQDNDGSSKMQSSATSDDTERSLAAQANEAHRSVLGNLRSAIYSAMRAGQALIVAKSQFCKHGNWQQWVEEHFVGSYRSAAAYMSIARNWTMLYKEMQDDPGMSIHRALELTADMDASKEKKAMKARMMTDDRTPEYARECLKAWLRCTIAEWSDEDVIYAMWYAPTEDSPTGALEEARRRNKALAGPFMKARKRQHQVDEELDLELGHARAWVDDEVSSDAREAFARELYECFKDFDNPASLSQAQRALILERIRNSKMVRMNEWPRLRRALAVKRDRFPHT